MSSSLGEAFPREQARLRGLLEYTGGMGPELNFYRAVIEDVLRRADKAAMEQDVVAMIRIFKEMQEIEA